MFNSDFGTSGINRPVVPKSRVKYVNLINVTLLFGNKFYAFAIFGLYTHHINTRLIRTHVKGGHVSVHMAVVNHLAECVHHGDVIDAWCNNVHIVRGGVGIDRDRYVVALKGYDELVGYTTVNSH